MKFIKKYIDAQLVNASFTFAVIYCILFNSAIYIYKFNHFNGNALLASIYLFKELIYSVIILFILFFGLTSWRFLFVIGGIFLFFTGAVGSYYFYPRDKVDMIAVIFNLHNLFTIKFLIWVGFSMLICGYSMMHFRFSTSKMFLTRILSALCLYLSLSNMFYPSNDFLGQYFPMRYMHDARA